MKHQVSQEQQAMPTNLISNNKSSLQVVLGKVIIRILTTTCLTMTFKINNKTTITSKEKMNMEMEMGLNMSKNTKLRKVLLTQAFWSMARRRVEEFRFGLMVHAMKVIGKKIKLMEKVLYFMLMEISTVVNGDMTKPMDTENTNMQMAQFMSVIGTKTNNMEKE
jgi:hypothetical protein